MKLKLLFQFLILTQFLSAQTFTEVPQSPPFDGVWRGSVAFSDLDGDGDEDVLITGDSSGGSISKLYISDGTGNFSEMPDTPFDDVLFSSVAFSDMDGDGDDDVLITGSSSVEKISKLYINDGTGNFSEMTDTPFEGVWLGSVAFSDVDSDGDDDVIITGENSSYLSVSKLYTNDGTGNFTEMTGTPFDGVRYSSVTFSDVDGDGDDDVLITGLSNSYYELISKMYTNDGMGNFTEMTDTPFDGVGASSVAFSDVDNDGDGDVLITGTKDAYENEPISKLYINDGTGNFSEMTGTPFAGVLYSSVAFSDVDGDGDEDVLITGENSSEEGVSKLYTNDGMGNFSEMTDTPFDGVWKSSIAFSDLDSDGDEDVLITGENSPFGLISKLYINDGMGNFSELTDTPFVGVWGSSVAFSDVDDDGDEDVLITGLNNTPFLISKLYINDGSGNFSEMTNTPFDPVWSGSIAFSDVDSDGDGDVLITGNSFGEEISKLYINDGTGNFSELTGTSFDGVRSSSVAFSDVDGDGNNDVLITGKNSSDELISKLYTNDGMGNFTEMTDTPFDGVFYSSVAFSDVDGDGDNDVLITGLNNSDERISKLYINDGTGNFSEMTGTPFDGVWASSVAFSDVDGDGNDDLLITGENSSDEQVSKLYINDGMGNFSEITDTPFDGVESGSIAFSDVDADGDEDILITGINSSLGAISKLYINDGTGNFSEMAGTPFDGVNSGSVAFSDFDGDGDADVLITGLNSSGELIAKLYRNDGVVSTDDLIVGFNLEFTPYPNPTKSNNLYLSYDSADNGFVMVRVYDLKGQLLSQQKELVAIGQNTFSIDITALIQGSYFIELGNGKRRGVVKFIVQ